MNEQVLVYEIKSGAVANAKILLTESSFFWNDQKFQYLNDNDYVFVVNTHDKYVLFARFHFERIKSTLDQATLIASFTYGDQVFNPKAPTIEKLGEWSQFVRLEVLTKLTIPENWAWKSLGNSETTYLNGTRVDSTNINRISNINQLKELNKEENYTNILETCLENFSANQLKQEIIDAIESEIIQKSIEENDFHFQIAQTKLLELENYIESQPTFFKKLYDDFVNSNKTYKEFKLGLDPKSEQHKLILLIGQVVSYCDLNAADKNELNEYEDKRTLARSFVRQTDWVKSLLNFKSSNNDLQVLPPSIRNAIAYLKKPSDELTMLSENHRLMVSKYFLKQTSYNKSTFVSSLIEYFKPYNIEPKNKINLTRIISNILYRFPNVKKLWFERLEGLVVCDNTGWIEEAIEDKSGSKYIALWWDKSPSGGNQVIKLLRECIDNSEEHCFYIYYTINQVAHYKSRIVDFSFHEEYPEKDWNKNNDVAWYQPNFADYKGKNKNGSDKFAKIIFLADEIEKLNHPISVEHFEFYNGHAAPTQNNMQPFTEINIEEDFDSNKNTNEMETPKEIIKHAHEFITHSGFNYQYDEIANFYLALRAKPFVILAGISGTGKTQLPRKFAASLGFSKEQIIQLPVRPDWTDSSDLLGYTSLEGNFIPKDLTLAIQKAILNPDKPYFFILDEMNLARVEHYFSDYLSVIETRERVGNEIKTDPILREEILKTAKNKTDFTEIGLPQNLYLIGTVNMDETTHAFSKKVLDRANSIEMNEVDLNWITNNGKAVQKLENISNELFKTVYLHSIDLSEVDKKSISDEMNLLQSVNKILEKADLHFAYRVRDEIAFYLILNKSYELMNSNTAFDFQLVQKILPRIHGSSERVQTVLVELLNLLEGKDFRSSNFEFSMLTGKIDFDNLKYKRTSKKIVFMLKRFDDDRFTSFWL